jgi:UDP-N-acetylglucosamine acyltransferase
VTATVRIHPTAVVHPGAVLGEGCAIGPHAVIEDAVTLGARCVIEAGAVVKSHTTLGDDNHVHEHAVLGGPPQDLKFKGHVSHVRIGHRNVLREHVTVHRATAEGGETRIGNDCFLMAQCHVGHECRIGDHVILANATLLAGHVRVDDRAFLPGGTAVHQFCRIGRNTLAGGVTAIRQDVLPFTLVTGSPARTIGLNSIGLRRAGFSAADLRLLRRALRVLFGAGGKEERLRELEAFDAPQVRELVEFVRTSRRGVCDLRRNVRGARTDDEASAEE